jgi:hypothetical protein
MPFKNREDLYASQERHRNSNHEKMWSLLIASECHDCNTKDARVLEFDHRPGSEKKFNVAKAISGSTRSWKTIKKEIDKCDIVCANCHRIRTMERGNYKRQISHTSL